LTATGPALAHRLARMNTADLTIERVSADEPGLEAALAALLTDAVADGASVGFLWPLAAGEAQAWATNVRAALGPGLALWVARAQGAVVGCVQLGPCLKPNGRHRGEVMKLLVHRRARGCGVASRLMRALEQHARASGLTLLVLDTMAGSPAEAVYRHLGWQLVGQVPDYAAFPDGRLGPTAVFYKRLT
jgi:GNAT superfamily N-acetyltransferase